MQTQQSIQEAQKNEYENYTETSKNYDFSRYPVGYDEMIEAFKEFNEKATVYVDIGCGTGNYLINVGKNYEKATGIDLNEGMLAQCQAKIDKLKLSHIKIMQGTATKLPFDDASVDIMSACQTIHHYGSDENRLKFFKEAFRVLRPGGVLIVNHSTDEQAIGSWYFYFSERVKELAKTLYNTRDELKDLVSKAGLEIKKEIKISVPCQRLDIFYNPELYLTKQGRDQDSGWSLYNEEELKVAISTIEQLVKEKSFEEWLKTHGDPEARERGFSTHFVLMKPQ